VLVLPVSGDLPGQRGPLMRARDRLANLGLLATAGIAWILVGLVVTTRDPRIDPGAGFVGAVLIGLAVGITAMPLFWLLAFARHRRIAYRGDWIRAIRRGAWIALIIAVLVVLRLQNLFQIPIALFIIAVVSVAEAMLSSER
jgi:NO-binding membrane sensor protein with MHYT domain